MGPADAPALEHRARSRRWRRRLLVWAVLAVPAVWSLLALVHAYAMCAMGWQALSAPTRERFALYVGLDPAGNVVVEDPFPDRVPPFDPLFEPGLDHSRAIVLVIYEAVAEVPRMRPDRTDLYRAVIRLESQPSPETVVIPGAEGERTLDAVQAEQLKQSIVGFLREKRFLLVRIENRVPLAYGQSRTHASCPVDAATSARFGAWALLAAPAAVLWAVFRGFVRNRRLRRGRCAWCAHPIEGAMCLECGTRYGLRPPRSSPGPSS